MKVAFLLLLLLLGAGCAQPSPAAYSSSSDPGHEVTSQTSTNSPIGTPTQTPNRSPTAGSVVFFECKHFNVRYFAHSDAIEALLPQGFTTDPLAPVTEANVEAFDCDYAVVDNQTVIQAPSIAWILVQVEVPSGTQSPMGADAYVLEFFMNNQTLGSLFATNGFPSVPAETTVTTSGRTAGMTISGASGPVFEFNGSGNGTSGPPEIRAEWRNHRVESNHSWLDIADEGELSDFSIAGIADPTGHVVGTTAVGGDNPFPTTGVIDPRRLTIAFSTSRDTE